MRIRASIVVLVAIIATGCSLGGPAAEATPATASPFPTVTTTQPAATTTPSPTPRFGPDDIAEVVTTDLVVRSAPGTGSDSRIYQIRLASPTLLYIFDGPTFADGYDWYLVLPASLSYLPSGYGVGWVAAGNDGEAWIGAADPDCPGRALEQIVARSGLANLACSRSQALTLTGVISNCRPRDPLVSPEMVWAKRCALGSLGYTPDIEPAPGSLQVWFDVDLEIASTTEARAAQVTGHFDDPRARECLDVPGPEGVFDARLQEMDFRPPSGWGVFLCRTQFVATAGVALLEVPDT